MSLKKAMLAKGKKGKATAKKAAKKTTNKKTTTKKETTRKKAIGFEFPEESKENIEALFDKISTTMDEAGEHLAEYLEGKKKSAMDARKSIQDMVVTGKELRKAIQESKEELVPIYKED